MLTDNNVETTMNVISNGISILSESETLAMATKLCHKLKAQGFDVINLSLSEPDFSTEVS